MSNGGHSDEEIFSEQNADNKTGEWVEDLFPPKFRLLLEEPSCNRVTTSVLDRDGQVLSEDRSTTENCEELFAKLARKISPLDVAAVKNVYQRVWLMTAAAESGDCK